MMFVWTSLIKVKKLSSNSGNTQFYILWMALFSWVPIFVD